MPGKGKRFILVNYKGERRSRPYKTMHSAINARYYMELSGLVNNTSFA